VLVRRLRRVEGQIGGLVRMLESGRECADVVTQLAAASRALDRVGFLLVAGELRACMTSDGAAVDPAQAAKASALEKLFLTLA
jgi:DNA-binding FrmR family transcriptional regulator